MLILRKKNLLIADRLAQLVECRNYRAGGCGSVQAPAGQTLRVFK